MIKAIFFDVDGTLIPHGEMTIPESVLKALKIVQNKGVKLFVATGRVPNSMKHVSEQFHFDGYLTSNGQYCFTDNEVIYEKYIPTQSIEELIPYLEENKVPVLFATLESCYRNIHNTDFDAHWPIIDYTTINDKQIVQIMAPIDPSEDEEFLKHLPGCKSARWTDVFADIIPECGGKEYGIDRIIDHFGISLKETMACGDGGNDITMLKHVPYSVAMGNAKDEVKIHADFVTTDILEDGIINAFKHYGLLDEKYRG